MTIIRISFSISIESTFNCTYFMLRSWSERGWGMVRTGWSILRVQWLLVQIVVLHHLENNCELREGYLDVLCVHGFFHEHEHGPIEEPWITTLF